MDQSDEREAIQAGLAKHLQAIAAQQAIIAAQQKQQTEYLRNISTVFTLLLIAVVLFLLVFAAWVGIF